MAARAAAAARLLVASASSAFIAEVAPCMAEVAPCSCSMPSRTLLDTCAVGRSGAGRQRVELCHLLEGFCDHGM